MGWLGARRSPASSPGGRHQTRPGRLPGALFPTRTGVPEASLFCAPVCPCARRRLSGHRKAPSAAGAVRRNGGAKRGLGRRALCVPQNALRHFPVGTSRPSRGGCCTPGIPWRGILEDRALFPCLLRWAVPGGSECCSPASLGRSVGRCRSRGGLTDPSAPVLFALTVLRGEDRAVRTRARSREAPAVPRLAVLPPVRSPARLGAAAAGSRVAGSAPASRGHRSSGAAAQRFHGEAPGGGSSSCPGRAHPDSVSLERVPRGVSEGGLGNAALCSCSSALRQIMYIILF